MKKWKKTGLSLLMILVLVAGALTGCMGEEIGIGVNADGTCSFSMKYLYEKEMFDEMAATGEPADEMLLSGDFTQTTEKVNGKDYYAFSRSFQFANTEQMKSFLTDNTVYAQEVTKNSKNPSSYGASDLEAPFQSVVIDATQFVGDMSTSGAEETGVSKSPEGAGVDESAGIRVDKEDIAVLSGGGHHSIMDYYKSLGVVLNIAVTLPAPIVESNGVIAGNTATWTIENIPDDNRVMAFTTGNKMASDTTAPVITGVKNNALYNKRVIIRAEDEVGVKSLLINGISMNSTVLNVQTSGRYTVTATDYNNNSTTVKFRVDTTKPKISVKGVTANGTISKKGVTLRFSDNVGVKSVKINGKKVNKKKVTLKKARKYTVKVTDKAGNVTIRKFRIRKA